MGESRVGVIAGGGALPREAARALASSGTPFRRIGFEGVGETSEADVVLRLGQVERLAETLAEESVDRVLLVGQFDPALVESDLFEPDAVANALSARFRGRPWVAWMRGIADWLEARGFALCRQDFVLAPLLAAKGRLAGPPPSGRLETDAAIGFRALASCVAEDLAQAVAVRGGEVVAVETVAGTDALIREAGPGVTIVKGARPDQDPRMDLPAVGPGTIAALAASGADGLAVEAGRTLVLERGDFEAAAGAAGLPVLGVERPGEGV